MSRVTAADRVDVWRDVIRDHFVALDIRADRGDDFSGRVQATDIGQLNVARVESVSQAVTRTPALVRDADEDYLQVGMITRGAARVTQDGREAVLAPGDFTVYETDRPFHWELRNDWELLVFTWPRATVPVPVAESASLTARCLSGADGLGAILARMLRGLVDEPPQLSPDGGVRLGTEVAELVTTLAQEQARGAEPTRTAAHLAVDVERYILEHLADPDLGPATIAAAHFISTRHLHRLFAGRGNSVVGFIQQLRLERARLDLRHPGYANRSITEVAGRWGFLNLPAFSRAFRSAYGVTPTQARAARVARPATARPARPPTRDPRLPLGQYDAADDWPVLSGEAPPRLNPHRWSLSIDGLVRRPSTWTWDELHELPQSVFTADLHAGTTWSKLGTRFGGISLDLLLDAAGPEDEAAFVLATASTGYTTNLPLAHVTGGRAWIVWTHDGKPLPREHGGPARLLVPHLYLWKSAKWVIRLTLLDHDEPGVKERNGYHDVGDPWREQRYRGD